MTGKGLYAGGGDGARHPSTLLWLQADRIVLAFVLLVGLLQPCGKAVDILCMDCA